MPMTPIQALQAVKDRGLVLDQLDGGWRARTKERTRLHKGIRPTYEDAVESAIQALDEADRAKTRDSKERLFDLLGTGRVRFEYREETIPGEGGGMVPRFDIYDSKGVRIINGAASLHEAVLGADTLGAFSTTTPPSMPAKGTP